jgi:mono/diheme cytochrome c family protein
MAVLKRTRDDYVKLSSNYISQPKLHWLALGVIYALTGAPAQAQNLDQGKSAPQLFADSCATCHRSPRGLAKGRLRLTLYSFLQDHYSTSSNTAGELASYLASVDVPQRPATGKPKRAAASRSSAYPPASTQSN